MGTESITEMSEEINYNNYPNIDYDNGTSDPHSIFNWNELVPTLAIYGVTFILGLTGNILIIFTTFKYRRMKSVTNIFLSSLASSDLLLIIFCIPIKVAKLFSYTWEMGALVCKGVHYMQNLSTICSVLTLTTISIERYYAILHPMKAKYICTMHQSKRIICVIWILSILLTIPTIEGQVHLPVGPNNEYRYCVRNWDNSAIWKFHELYMLLLVLVFPFCIMTYSYTHICWEVWKIMERRSEMISEQTPTKNYISVPIKEKYHETPSTVNTRKLNRTCSRTDTHTVKQIISMLVTVVVLFAVCWTPLLIDNVLTAYGVLPHMRFGTIKYMSTTFHLMAYFNSCVNPVIYGFMSKNFRESFILAVCFSSESRTNLRESTYSLKLFPRRGSQTRSSSFK